MLIRSLSLIAVIASIAACSSTRYCAREQSYEKSVSIPPIVAPERLHFTIKDIDIGVAAVGDMNAELGSQVHYAAAW